MSGHSWADARRMLESLIGRPAWDPVEVLVRASDIQRYEEAVGYSGRVDDGADGVVAPPLFLPPFAVGGAIAEDGRRRRPGEVPIDHPAVRRRLLAGCDVRFEEPIRAGETIRASTTYESVSEKVGREGPMLFVTTATEYRRVDGALKRVERWTVIHR